MLSKAAQRFLSSPATSVPSERLFSSAGDICLDKRTCLLAENVERLVFLKANMNNFSVLTAVRDIICYVIMR